MRSLFALATLVALAAVPLAVGGACVPTCTVFAHTEQFVPAVTQVDSGSTVTWHSLDSGHSASDGNDLCFNTFFNLRDGRATFVIAGGALYAAGEGDAFEPCPSASALPDGSFALDYTCLFHGNMNAKLLVR